MQRNYTRRVRPDNCPPEMKWCQVCNTVKPYSDFNKCSTHKDGHCKECRICQTIRRRKYNARPEVKQRKKAHKYNIRVEQMMLLSKQKTACEICHRDFADLAKKDIHIDHCHKTGSLRGILCSFCNKMLGFAKDDPQVLLNAIKYLERASRIG